MAEMPENPLKTCRKCEISQPLDRFPFRKAEQCYRHTCKACRAAESHALRHHPAHADRIREAERVRSLKRRPAILKWQREHPDNMRPGRQRRALRRLLAARRSAYRPMLNAFRVVLPPLSNRPEAPQKGLDLAKKVQIIPKRG